MVELASIIIAIVALVVSVSVERLQIRQDRSHYLDSVWRQIMASVDEQLQFGDISKTENYLEAFDWNQRLRYDSFCIQAWTACYQLSRASRKLPLDQRLAIEWMVAYHREWLRGNARLFPDERFWRLVEKLEAADPRITIHRPVPSVEGLATWDDLLGRYFDTFLSPFDPDIPADRRLETVLSTVIDQRRPVEHPVTVDLGCGIGTAFHTLNDAPGRFHGLDISIDALKTSRTATRLRPPLVNGDLRRLPYRDNSVDLVIAVNAILMESREDNQRAFDEVARILRPDGIAILVLPAFETITHLRQLRVNEAHDVAGDRYAQRVERAFDHLRSPDEANASYADDGVTRQYFHSRDTIQNELGAAGIDVIDGPTEFYYPWEVTRSYNYGFYPGQKETWDWIVIGRKTAPPHPEQ